MATVTFFEEAPFKVAAAMLASVLIPQYALHPRRRIRKMIGHFRYGINNYDFVPPQPGSVILGGYARRHYDFFHPGAAFEGIFSNRLQPLWKRKPRQTGTASEGTNSDLSQPLRERELRQTGAAFEGIRPNRRQPLRKRELRQTGTASEGTNSDLSQPTGKRNGGQILHPLETA